MVLANPTSDLFQSFFIGGFEASCHRLRNGRRLNLLAATGHEEHAAADYRRLAEHGIRTARDGICWPEIERSPGHYDFSSAPRMIRAARDTGTQVIWDVCHYGWPDDIDVFSPEFVRRFAQLARNFARVLVEEGDPAPFIAPINEISFLAWAGGDAGYLNPFEHNRSFELKMQLVRAAIEGIEAVWQVAPLARIVHVDPIINIVADPRRPKMRRAAEDARLAMYQAWDMLRGSLRPELGGDEKYLDIVGVNYYHNNQWILDGPTLEQSNPFYRPFSSILREVYERYGRPLFISETGREGDERAAWLRYVSEEARAAMRDGVPLEGITLYPVLDYPGWDNDRYCPTGLFTYADEHGHRDVCEPLALELRRQTEEFEWARQLVLR